MTALERILTNMQVKREGAVFSTDTPAAGIDAAGTRFGRALNRLYELAASRTLDT